MTSILGKINSFAMKKNISGENVWRRRLRSLILFVFFLFCMWYVVQALVAYQFQHKLRNTKINNYIVSTQTLKAYHVEVYEQGKLYWEEVEHLETLQNKAIAKGIEIEIEKEKEKEKPDGDEIKPNPSLTKLHSEFSNIHCQVVAKIDRVHELDVDRRKLHQDTAQKFGFSVQISDEVADATPNGAPKTSIVPITPGNQGSGSTATTKLTKPPVTSIPDGPAAQPASGHKLKSKLGLVQAKANFGTNYPFVIAGSSAHSEIAANSKCSPKEYSTKDFLPPPLLNPQVSELLQDYKYLSHSKKRDCNCTKKEVWFKKLVLLVRRVMYFPNFIAMPNQMLVLAVVFLMGALGATLALAREHLNKDKKMLAWDTFLFKPLLGSVTAFAVYILAKAGVIIIADFGSGNEANINPYFISFVGLASGMLTDNALRTIQNVGLKWFKNAEEQSRYWRGDESLTAFNKDKEALIAYLEREIDISKNIITNWLDGKVRVPESAQYLIAAYIGGSRRDLFTDFPSLDLKSEADTPPNMAELAKEQT